MAHNFLLSSASGILLALMVEEVGMPTRMNFCEHVSNTGTTRALCVYSSLLSSGTTASSTVSAPLTAGRLCVHFKTLARRVPLTFSATTETVCSVSASSLYYAN